MNGNRSMGAPLAPHFHPWEDSQAYQRRTLLWPQRPGPAVNQSIYPRSRRNATGATQCLTR